MRLRVSGLCQEVCIRGLGSRGSMDCSLGLGLKLSVLSLN